LSERIQSAFDIMKQLIVKKGLAIRLWYIQIQV